MTAHGETTVSMIAAPTAADGMSPRRSTGPGPRKGFVLVKTAPGAAPRVAAAARELAGVGKAVLVEGAFDVILHVHETSAGDDLAQIRSLRGVLRALPCWMPSGAGGHLSTRPEGSGGGGP